MIWVVIFLVVIWVAGFGLIGRAISRTIDVDSRGVGTESLIIVVALFWPLSLVIGAVLWVTRRLFGWPRPQL